MTTELSPGALTGLLERARQDYQDLAGRGLSLLRKRADAAEAHRLLDAGRHVGKILLVNN